jgi:hypothetical protein
LESPKVYLEAIDNLSNALNTNELTDVFQGRVGRLLDAIGADREKVVKGKAKNNNNNPINNGGP